MRSDSLFLRVFCFKFVLFINLFPFECPKQKSKRANRSCLSFKRQMRVNCSVALYCTKQATRVIRSVALYKKSVESVSHFEKSESHFHSFTLKKLKICSDKLKSEFPTMAWQLQLSTFLPSVSSSQNASLKPSVHLPAFTAVIVLLSLLLNLLQVRMQGWEFAHWFFE